MRVLLLVCLFATLVAAEIPGSLDEETYQQFVAHTEIIKQRLRQLEEIAKSENGDQRIAEDALLTTPELISKYGYPVESHDIVTEDGYILTFHRIPYGKNSQNKVANAKPLFLQHGLMSSSDDWIVTGPEKAFGYILADAGYDVWIGNSRGNKWSRRHVTLNPDKKKFWDFSWHEMGVYDLPAAIDYILNATGKEQLHYIGHSMGTTMFTVMGAERPEYNSKIRVAALMAPAVFFEYRNDLILTIVTKYMHQLDTLAKLLGIKDIIKHHPIYAVIGDTFCKDEDPTQVLCLLAAELIGVNLEQFNATILPVFLGHFPAGAAAKDFLHYGQSINTGDFRQYDHGKLQNLVKYGSSKPPKYNIAKISTPVILQYSQNDGTVMPEDVLTLAKLLPNLIGVNKVPNEKFNHLDFVIANQARELAYDVLINQFEKF